MCQLHRRGHGQSKSQNWLPTDLWERDCPSATQLPFPKAIFGYTPGSSASKLLLWSCAFHLAALRLWLWRSEPTWEDMSHRYSFSCCEPEQLRWPISDCQADSAHGDRSCPN